MTKLTTKVKILIVIGLVVIIAIGSAFVHLYNEKVYWQEDAAQYNHYHWEELNLMTWVCGRIIGLNGYPHFDSKFRWAHTTKRYLDSSVPIPYHIFIDLLDELLQCYALPGTAIEHLVLHSSKKSFTG